MMLGMQILRIRGNPPPQDLGETQVFSTQAPKTLENYRVLDTQHTMPKKWQPQKPSALIRDPKEDQVADCHLHARLASADLNVSNRLGDGMQCINVSCGKVKQAHDFQGQASAPPAAEARRRRESSPIRLMASQALPWPLTVGTSAGRCVQPRPEAQESPPPSLLVR